MFFLLNSDWAIVNWEAKAHEILHELYDKNEILQIVKEALGPDRPVDQWLKRGAARWVTYTKYGVTFVDMLPTSLQAMKVLSQHPSAAVRRVVYNLLTSFFDSIPRADVMRYCYAGFSFFFPYYFV